MLTGRQRPTIDLCRMLTGSLYRLFVRARTVATALKVFLFLKKKKKKKKKKKIGRRLSLGTEYQNIFFSVEKEVKPYLELYTSDTHSYLEFVRYGLNAPLIWSPN